jgi:hypothetical protein
VAVRIRVRVRIRNEGVHLDEFLNDLFLTRRGERDAVLVHVFVVVLNEFL